MLSNTFKSISDQNNKKYTKVPSVMQGTNPGAVFKEEKTSKEYYIKWFSPEFDGSPYGIQPNKYKHRNKNRARAEVLASKLYALYGTKVINAEYIVFHDQSKNEYVGIKTEIEKNIDSIGSIWDANNFEPYRIKAQEDFLIDVLLANYDVIGFGGENLCYYTDSNNNKPALLRLDFGGALLYRAQGKPKKEEFSEEASEFESLESGKNVGKTTYSETVLKQAQRVFSGVHDSPALLIGLNKLLSVSDKDIERCVLKNGFEEKQTKNHQLKNNKLIKLLLARKRNIIAKAESALFKQLIKKYLHTLPGGNQDPDTSYKNYEGNLNINPPIYRVKHGAMHASRVACYTEQFIDLLQKAKYEPAVSLTEKDRFLIKVAAMFHDTGRRRDSGADQAAWEAEGARLCYEWLLAGGFSEAEAKKAQEAIINKDNPEYQKNDIYSLIVGASDSLDWVRSHGSDYDVAHMPEIIKDKISNDSLIGLAKAAKGLATAQGDSPRAQLGQGGSFDINLKKKYEYNVSGCYNATKEKIIELKCFNVRNHTILSSTTPSSEEKDSAFNSTHKKSEKPPIKGVYTDLEKLFKDAIDSVRARLQNETEPHNQKTLNHFKNTLIDLKKKTLYEVDADTISLNDAWIIASNAKALAENTTKTQVAIFKDATKNFQQSWSWRVILGAVIGAVIGIVVGAMIGAAAGPGAALTSFAGGVKGAVIGATFFGGGGVLTGAGFGMLSTSHNDPIIQTSTAAIAICK